MLFMRGIGDEDIVVFFDVEWCVHGSVWRDNSREHTA